MEIWKKWSITQKLDMPACSASTAIRRSVGPMEWGEPGQVKSGTCSPMRMAPSDSCHIHFVEPCRAGVCRQSWTNASWINAA